MDQLRSSQGGFLPTRLIELHTTLYGRFANAVLANNVVSLVLTSNLSGSALPENASWPSRVRGYGAALQQHVRPQRRLLLDLSKTGPVRFGCVCVIAWEDARLASCPVCRPPQSLRVPVPVWRLHVPVAETMQLTTFCVQSKPSMVLLLTSSRLV